MMKKIFVIALSALALFVSTEAYAQFSIGAGYLNDKERLMVRDDDGIEQGRGAARRHGFYAGAQYGVPIVGGLSVVPGLYATMQFSKSTDNSSIWGGSLSGAETTEYSELAINLPVNVQYSMEVGDISAFAFVGPVLQYGLFSKTKSTGTLSILGISDTTTAVTDNYTGKTTSGSSTIDGDPIRKPFNVYLGGGLGVVINDSLQITVGYDHSLTNISAVKNNILSRSQFKIGAGFIF